MLESASAASRSTASGVSRPSSAAALRTVASGSRLSSSTSAAVDAGSSSASARSRGLGSVANLRKQPVPGKVGVIARAAQGRRGSRPTKRPPRGAFPVEHRRRIRRGTVVRLDPRRGRGALRRRREGALPSRRSGARGALANVRVGAWRRRSCAEQRSTTVPASGFPGRCRGLRRRAPRSHQVWRAGTASAAGALATPSTAVWASAGCQSLVCVFADARLGRVGDSNCSHCSGGEAARLPRGSHARLYRDERPRDPGRRAADPRATRSPSHRGPEVQGAGQREPSG